MPETDDLHKRLDKLESLVNTLVELNRLQALGPDRVLSFSYYGETVSLWLPDAHYDYIQKVILNRNVFYEIRMLQQLAELGYIGSDTTVCDIGANIGNHSVFFGKILGAKKVISFEPQAHANKVLQRNLELNGMDPSNARRVIIADQEGTGSVDGHKTRNIGGTSFKADKGGSVPMQRLSDALDASDRSKIDFMKIDVEGAELAVLAGAASVIEECKPVIWIELLKGQFDATNDVLKGYGYKTHPLGKADFLFIP